MEAFPFKLKVATRAFNFSEKSWTLKYFFSLRNQAPLSSLYLTVERGWFGLLEFFEIMTFGMLSLLLLSSGIRTISSTRRSLRVTSFFSRGIVLRLSLISGVDLSRGALPSVAT